MQKLCRSVWYWKTVFVCTPVFCLLVLGGCGPTLSSAEQVERFKRAGPVAPEVDIDGPTGGKIYIGPYRVVPGDVLEFQMPAVLQVISSDLSEWLRPISGHKYIEAYLVRVSAQGTVVLPIVGELPVSGKTLARVESTVISAYFPKYVVNPPMVVCEVKRYQNESERVFTVMGLVNHPNAFPYPPDVQYNLMEALAFAGGLNLVADPRYVKVYRQNATGEIVSATFGIDNKSFADAYNVMIKPGDVIYVDHTLRTRTNAFLSNVLSVGVGADVRYGRNR